MTKNITISVMCIVAVVLAALFTVTQLTAKDAESRGRYKPSIRSNKMKVDLISKRYFRNDNGCVTRVEFYNDPANCAGLVPDPGEPQCPTSAQAQWVQAIRIDKTPIIWNEELVGAGTTTGQSDPCGEWRFTLAGSPGWDCDYLPGPPSRIVCSCIGYQIGDWCCDPTGCTQKP